eukprot:CAMPEP_0195508836 /NCGR_PEP_ID=MMETSP0794_2-20130614/1940_1 /TAXON_ID=515487 /ORGANISM="Stephanopyxis turris, Strain CCMP 815" /LENGTH=181 /DNA_ID=CAMNT_0040635907 /DNA_START=215 /DNA_END=760 /DNA_ORIENTATION=+
MMQNQQRNLIVCAMILITSMTIGEAALSNKSPPSYVTKKKAASAGLCMDQQQQPAAPAFGVARSTALLLRGGEVHEMKTLEDLKLIIKDATADGKLVVIDFTASWCGPCKLIAPFYKELSESDECKNVVFLKVDVDENSETAKEYSVSAMPTFLFIKNGEVVDRLMGASTQRLVEIIQENS